MRYGSVCSGIEAATVAWHSLGWEPAFFSEIEPFPRAVLAHHYPQVPLHGDFTTIGADEYGAIDLLVGGTPCQSFSIAGLRGGLDDDRGNLALEFLRLADRKRPRWLVWENVPGVLSSNGGRDFGSILGGMVELGYGIAYRILDAQHFGVPQRRRRVFVVGHLGDYRRAAAVLFERHSLSGHPAPRRETREAVAALTANGVGTCGADDNQGQAGHLIGWPADVAPTIDAHYGDKMGYDNQHISGGGDCLFPTVAMCLNAGAMGRQDAESETLIPSHRCDFDVAHSLRGEGFDASEDGTGRGTPLVPVAFDCKGTEVQFSTDGTHPTLRSMGHANSHTNGGGHAAVAYPLQEVGKRTGVSTDDKRAGIGIGGDTDPMFTLQAGAQHGVAAFDLRGREHGAQFEGPHDTANIRASSGGSSRSYVASTAVRRLTPEECEKLQGFLPGYTAVPNRGKLAADGPRYKALGNSMAVPCMVWLGQRIQMVEDLCSTSAKDAA